MNERDSNERDDEDLILYHYGELAADEARSLEEAMAASPTLRARYRRLEAALDRVEDDVGDPGADFEQRVWARLEPALPGRPHARRPRPWFSRITEVLGSRAALPLAAASVLVLTAALAFHAGRSFGPDASPEVADHPNPGARRVLAASVADHLSGSERLMLDLVNRSAGSLPMDLEAERRWAESLLTANRLYRYAAEQAGQPRIAGLLAEMEPLLLALANSEANGTAPGASNELKSLQQRIARRDLLFKVRSTRHTLAIRHEV